MAEITTTEPTTQTTPPVTNPPAPAFAGKYATEAEFATALTGIATKRGLDLAVPEGKKLIGDVFTKDTAEMLYKQLAGKALADLAPPTPVVQPPSLDDAGVKAEMAKAGVDLTDLVTKAMAGTMPDAATLEKIGAAALKANPKLVGEFVLNHNKMTVVDFQRRTTDAQAEARKLVGDDKAGKMLEWAKNNMGAEYAAWEAGWKNPDQARDSMLKLSGLYAVNVPPTGPADQGVSRQGGLGGGAFSTTPEWKAAQRESEAKYGNAMDDPAYAARAVATMKSNPSIMRS